MNSIGQQTLGVSNDDNNNTNEANNNIHTSESGSGLNLTAIAESHREMTRSQSDLKRQFEEFSRNLSFRRTRGVTSKKKLGQHNHVTIPEIAVSDETAAAEAEDAEDGCGDESGFGSGSGGKAIEFPVGFSRNPRPSV